MNGETSTGSILDAIFEKTANIEYSNNSADISRFISDALRGQARRERILRESTVTFMIKENLGKTEITEAVEGWLHKNEQLPATIWQDKDYTYCQLDNKDTRGALVDHINKSANSELKLALKAPNSKGLYFTRKPVKFEISNVRANIKIERIKEILELICNAVDPITELREGKPQPVTKARSIFFKASAANAKTLLVDLDGMLPYCNQATQTRTKLYLRVNVKPWQCRECYRIGQHQCDGKKCAQCGTGGHSSKECKSKTKYCDVCKRKGHKAKEAQCPIYLNEIAKEIRKIDIPLEFYEDKELRFLLTKHLQIK